MRAEVCPYDQRASSISRLTAAVLSEMACFATNKSPSAGNAHPTDTNLMAPGMVQRNSNDSTDAGLFKCYRYKTVHIEVSSLSQITSFRSHPVGFKLSIPFDG